MDEASTQLREILIAGNLLVLPGLPGPPPSREAPQEELEAWERATLELSCLAPLAGLPQVSALISWSTDLAKWDSTKMPLETVCLAWDLTIWPRPSNAVHM